MSNIVINLAAEYTGRKAFKKAGSDVSSLEKGVKKLAKAFGLALSVQAVVDFGKASVKAFSEDQKSAVLLANAVKNLGLEMENPRISEFITNLSKSAAVADDELRPAMQKLLTTTGSVSKSQQMLSDAINISRGSGVDLATVAQDLSNAYVGNTKGLKKYNLGLTQAELKGSSFLDIQTKLNKQFSGASAAYLETYAGKMDALTVAAGEAQETIGKGLVDSLIILSGQSTGIDGVTASMEALSQQIADTFTGMSVLIKKLEDSKGIFGFIYGFFKDLSTSSLNLYTISKFLSDYAPYTEDPNSLQARQHAAYGGASARSAAEIAAQKRNKELAAAIKKQTAGQKALTAEQKKQAALKKAASIFDMEQIQIIAALKGNISNEERKRLELQLALATGNVEEAQKLTYQLAIAQGLSVKLAQELASLPAASNPFAAWKGYLDEIELQAKRIAGLNGTTSVTTNTPKDWSSSVGLSTQGYSGTGTGQGGSVMDNYKASQPSVVVQIDGKAIATAIQNQNNSGNLTGFSRLGDFKTL
jgi:phage terminase Nu1 subunit (DNA packaging protein)